jgi:predicted metal-dependent phosphoesterase TrpH
MNHSSRDILELKIDMHVHTCYSADSVITPEELVIYAKKRGLDGVAVTDHDRLDSALRMAERKDFLVVPGIEISCSEGHVVGLDVKTPVSGGLSADETTEKIHDAGGIAVACHPTGLFKGSLGSRVSSRFDAVEVINSSAVPFNYSVKRNEQIAASLKKPRLAGSDAHYGPEIGYAHTIVDSEPNVPEIIEAIIKGQCQPFGRSIPLTTRLKRAIAVRKRRV